MKNDINFLMILNPAVKVINKNVSRCLLAFIMIIYYITDTVLFHLEAVAFINTKKVIIWPISKYIIS